MAIVDIVGVAAAVCTTVAFIPQVVKVHRTRHTADLSLPMFLVFSIGVLLWLWYGLLVRSLPVIAANAITLVLSVDILVMKIRYK